MSELRIHLKSKYLRGKLANKFTVSSVSRVIRPATMEGLRQKNCSEHAKHRK